MVSGARLGDGCVQFRCVELVMVHRAGTRLGDNLGVWSLSVMVHRTSVYGTGLGDGCVQFRCGVIVVIVYCTCQRSDW